MQGASQTQQNTSTSLKPSQSTLDSMRIFSDTLIEKAVLRQRQLTGYCYERSNQDIDRFEDCIHNYFEVQMKNIPRIPTVIVWAGIQFNRCMARQGASETSCLADYRFNIEYFTPGLE